MVTSSVGGSIWDDEDDSILEGDKESPILHWMGCGNGALNKYCGDYCEY